MTNDIATIEPLRQHTALLPRNVTEAMSLAEFISKADLVPDHLRGKPANCLLIVEQSARWGMSPLAVAQGTSIVKGKLCYEGKLVAAALTAMNALEGRLEYEFSGSGQQRTVKITGLPRGGKKECVVEGTVERWATDNGNWKKDPDSMLIYRGTRQWARMYTPDALLGVYTPDEAEEIQVVDASIVETIPPKSGREAVARTQAPPSEDKETITKMLEEAAAKDGDTLVNVWKGLTEDQRDLIGPDFGRIKKLVPKA